jgi:hypothetical protein
MMGVAAARPGCSGVPCLRHQALRIPDVKNNQVAEGLESEER